MTSTDDQDSFLGLLEGHKKILYKVANAYCRNSHDRQDLIQEMATQVWRSYPRFDPQFKFSTWMYRIALNVAISFHQQEHSRSQHLLSGDEHLQGLVEERPPDLSEELQWLQGFIEGLDELHKALVLLYLDDCSHKDIAETLGISPSNVATKIGRIKERLRQDFVSATERTPHGTR
jgi:RNA polymerase sigma factor (sigma-70 family)